MRTIIAGLLLATVLAPLAVAATPQAPVEGPASGAETAAVPAGNAALDSLYDRLAKAKTQQEADGIATAIDRLRMVSGSDTADLLMGRALEASTKGDNALAIEMLSTVIRLKPDFTEAWNKRATLLFMENNFGRAMADIAETLKREPRHYGAWAGLGMILVHDGDKKRGYDAFKRALAINPFMEEIRKTVEDMRLEVEGEGI